MNQLLPPKELGQLNLLKKGHVEVDDELRISRDEFLLTNHEIQASLSDTMQFGFNAFTECPRLSYVPLEAKGCLQISPKLAQSRLDDVDYVRSDLTPLCLWAIDTVLNYQLKHHGQILLPARPEQDERLIILTRGKMTRNVFKGELAHHVFLKESEDGFKPLVLSDYDTLRLYHKPGYRLVALCAPKSSCVLESPAV